MAIIPPFQPAPASPGGGWVKIANITVPGGTVTNQIYQDPPNNTILQSATLSGLNSNLTVRASYPIVDIGGTLYTLNESGDGGHYERTIAISIVGAGTITVTLLDGDNNTAAIDSIVVAIDAPPEILTLEFTGGYPGVQTELKAGDSFQITGTTDKDADAIDISDFGAFTSSLEAIAVGQSFTVTGTIANRGTTLQALAGRARARDATSGAYGPTRDTDFGGGTTDGVNLVNCNNLYPSVSFGAITYPGAQQALKGSETANIVFAGSNLDTILFDSPTSELTITNPVTNEVSKTVQRIAGSYNVSTNNIRATANRAANDATSSTQAVVAISNVAPTITIGLPATRLRSGGNDGTSIQNHTITVQSNQQLLNAPSLDADAGGGTFTGSFSGGPSNWTRTLQVHDNDTKGTYTFQNLVATSLSGLVQNTISGSADYVLGGFVSRTLTFSAFSQTVTMGVEVITYTKLTAGIFTATNGAAIRNPVQGDTSDLVNTYTVTALAANPTTLFWNDVAAAGSNSGGTAQITNVQETI
jgi:hypothetical protein